MRVHTEDLEAVVRRVDGEQELAARRQRERSHLARLEDREAGRCAGGRRRGREGEAGALRDGLGLTAGVRSAVSRSGAGREPESPGASERVNGKHRMEKHRLAMEHDAVLA
jgi:hypothetical protein